MALLDIYGKEFIQAVSLILLCKNITTKSHQSHFEGPFANLLMVVSYSSVRFSRRATSSGIGPFSPLAYRCLLTNDHNRHTLVDGNKMTYTISDDGRDQAYSFLSRDQLPINSGMTPVKSLSHTLLQWNNENRQISLELYIALSSRIVLIDFLDYLQK